MENTLKTYASATLGLASSNHAKLMELFKTPTLGLDEARARYARVLDISFDTAVAQVKATSEFYRGLFSEAVRAKLVPNSMETAAGVNSLIQKKESATLEALSKAKDTTATLSGVVAAPLNRRGAKRFSN